ncbi:MAG: hypothetical protein HF982_00005 [Desulfobacteraceae bacterium]|nr:hypothetical protein [Desulfobacteraceae bacterium]MBC2717988.1 hypothetical protein [Desulfobacteraceae bacterium]
MRNYVKMCSLFFLFGVLVFAPIQAIARYVCTIDLENNTHNCQNTTAISFVYGPTDNKVVICVNLDSNVSGYTEAYFRVEYNEPGTEWTVNVGDSKSNNGYKGDGGHQSNDAEMQILGNTLTVYGSDYTPQDIDPLLNYSSVATTDQSIIWLSIKDQFFGWHYKGYTGEHSSPYLFALNGQNDDEGPINYDVYAAFNRTIGSSERDGSGVSKVRVVLD